jgi:Fe-S-cluster-containing hydrogenase component 2
MEALSMKDDVAQVDSKRCIGCGLCISTCQAGAMVLRPRAAVNVPVENSMQLAQAIVLSTKSDE